jgi:hypothetical protein
LTTDILREIFLERLTEIPPDILRRSFLQNFVIQLYGLVAWVITIGELYAAIGLLFRFKARLAAGISLFIPFGLAICGYYDASLIRFFIISLLLLCWSSGLWRGVLTGGWQNVSYHNAQ